MLNIFLIMCVVANLSQFPHTSTGINDFANTLKVDAVRSIPTVRSFDDFTVMEGSSTTCHQMSADAAHRSNKSKFTLPSFHRIMALTRKNYIQTLRNYGYNEI